MMLDHDQRLIAQGAPVQRLERQTERAGVPVGWIDQKKVVGDEVARVRPQPVDGIGTGNVALGGEAGCGQILGDDVSTGSIAVHEGGRRGATGERLDAERSGSGEQVQYPRTAYAVADDVEQRFPDE